MNKRKICVILAAVVSVCFLVCLVAAIRTCLLAAAAGADAPLGMVMLALVTGLLAVFSWKGVREMK